VADWQREIDRKWDSLRFEVWRAETDASRHRFEAEIFIGELDPEALRVELYADGIGGGDPERTEMTRAQALPADSPLGVYSITVPATRPAGDYTARVTPRLSGAALPLECIRILWQR
jgi:starch phosphorylase